MYGAGSYDVARAGEHHVGFPAAVLGAGPVPDAGAARAVHPGLLHGQLVEAGLLAGDDHVDVIAAAQSVVGDREQGVGVWRQVVSGLAFMAHHLFADSPEDYPSHGYIQQLDFHTSMVLLSAFAAVKTKDTYLAAHYKRLTSRRGPLRALVAVQHSISTGN